LGVIIIEHEKDNIAIEYRGVWITGLDKVIQGRIIDNVRKKLKLWRVWERERGRADL